MRKIILISYLVAVFFFAWGYTMVRFQWFPWKYVHPIEQEILAFIKGDIAEDTKVTEKIVNDLNIRPSRQLYDYQQNPQRSYRNLDIDGLRSRREQPRVFETPGQTRGYMFIYGSFDYDDSLHAGILLDPDNNVVHRWIVDQEQLKEQVAKKNAEDGGNRKLKSPSRRLPQGLEVLKDGTLILNEGYRGNGMQKVSWCSELLWTASGPYHHVVSLDEQDNTLWAFGKGDTMQLSLETGEVLREISLQQIHQANPGISIFTPRRRVSMGRWLEDPFHKNDIEPLQPRMASAFPQFDAGDMLVTHRSTNTVFVFDPTDLKVKWWRSGIVRRPHDADWQPDGTITIYDNNMREPVDGNDAQLDDLELLRYSRIVGIDPKTYEDTVLYDGETDDFYSGARGVHQVLPGGNILISSPYQGRVLEVTPEGETVFEFLNNYDDKEMLILTEARWFPEDYFEFDMSNRACN